jgi:small-conductance mechanosensitive channel
MRGLLLALATATLLFVAGQVAAQDAPVPPNRDFSADDGITAETVTLDGVVLLRIRGIAPDPARARALRIRQQVMRIADNKSIVIDDGRLVRGDDRISVMFDDMLAVTLFEADAQLENVQLEVLAEATLLRVREAISVYRAARSAEPLVRSTVILVGITLFAAAVLFLLLKSFAWLSHFLDNKVKVKMEEIDKASHRVLDTEQLGSWSASLLRGLRFVTIIAVLLTWLSVALGIYPWTRPFASSVFRVVLDPLRAIGSGILGAIPDMIFLIVLVLVVRFILRVAKTFFDRVHRGWIRLSDFDREWAVPTYRIVRVLIIAFAIVVAYPYIPGSSSDAFKGVSLFLGVIFSIVSSSFIANIIAGYSLTYRRAFRIGDRVRIGDLVGDVMETRVLSTRLKSAKNEEINIPNLEVLSSHVINYSSLQREHGLILHTRVGIGYDVPWRQVEAMLRIAAERTDGLSDDPKPFVLQISLDDFSCIYELNAYCNDASRMAQLYNSLHANIQDVFSEHGVQIMSPAYEGDPDKPKLVAPADWYRAPATQAAPVAGADENE